MMKSMRAPSVFVGALLAALPAAPAGAGAIYKWGGGQGGMHDTDARPARARHAPPPPVHPPHRPRRRPRRHPPRSARAPRGTQLQVNPNKPPVPAAATPRVRLFSALL